VLDAKGGPDQERLGGRGRGRCAIHQPPVIRLMISSAPARARRWRWITMNGCRSASGGTCGQAQRGLRLPADGAQKFPRSHFSALAEGAGRDGLPYFLVVGFLALGEGRQHED
jgi:hypothetical protein